MTSAAIDDVVAVVLTYGDGTSRPPLLDDLVDAGIAADRQVVVHNPAGTDPSPGDHVTILAPRNLGYAGGMDLGIANALQQAPSWILVCTEDVRIPADGIARLVAAARSAGRSVGAVGPLVSLHDDAVRSLGGEVGRWGRATHVVPRPGAGWPPPTAIARRCTWLDGCCILLAADAVRAVGGFDERLFLYHEDVDLGLRLRKAGWTVHIADDVVVTQVGGAPRRPGAYAYLMARNDVANRRRHVGRAAAAVGALDHVREHVARLARGPARRAATLRLGSAAVGIIHAFVGRWGPPPRWLPGMGDVHVDS